MPRCDGCGNKRCSCVLVDGDNTQVLGTGSPSDPYRVNVDIESVSAGFSGQITAFAGGTAPAGWLICNGAAVSRATYAALFAVCGETYGEGDGSSTFNLPDLAGRFPFGADGSHDRGTTGGVETITLTTGNLPAHTHSMAHTHGMGHAHGMGHSHDMSHGHGNVSSAGNHSHTVKQSNDDGTNNGTFDRGAQGDRDVATSSEGAHVHAVPAFGGSTGGDSRGGATDADNRGGITDGASAGSTGSAGSGTPYTNMPPYTAVSYIIKT